MALTNAERARRYRAAHPDRIKIQEGAYRPIAHARYLQRAYGLTVPEYDKCFITQNGKCAVCGRSNSGCQDKNGHYRKMYVDHDHTTGKVRGLLCSNCNMALGFVHDDPELLTKLAEYLRGG